MTKKKPIWADISFACDDCAGYGYVPTVIDTIEDCTRCQGKGWTDTPPVARGGWYPEAIMVEGVPYVRRR